MRILVTGGSSYIGSHLVRRLIAQGHEVRIAGRTIKPEFSDITVRADITDQVALSGALRGVELVYHLAAEHQVDVRPVDRYYRTNVEGMRILCEAASQNGVRKIVFTSSVAVYGSALNNATEDQSPEPDTDYGRSKLQAEQVLHRWQQASTGRQVAIIRPCAIFGPGTRSNVHALLDLILAGRFLMIGSGTNRRSLAYVGNVVSALIFVAKLEQDVVVNYSDKPDLSIQELVSVICDTTGRGIPRLRMPLWLGLLAGYLLDGLGRLTGRRFPIGVASIRQFCAEAVVNAGKMASLGYKQDTSLLDALRTTIGQELDLRA